MHGDRNSLLELEQVHSIADALYSTELNQRRQAGRLVATHVLNPLLKTALNQHLRQYGTERAEEQVHIALRGLAQYLKEQDRTTYPVVASFVDALWDALAVPITTGNSEPEETYVLQVRRPLRGTARAVIKWH